MRFSTLKRRSEFKRARGGARHATALFIIEARRRGDPGGFGDASGGVNSDLAGDEPPRSTVGREVSASGRDGGGPRFGFTITRKVGGAVVRNRIRRRLKEALRGLVEGDARAGHDYVVVASRAAHDYPFAGLQDALRDAFGRLHRQLDGGRGRGGTSRTGSGGRRVTTATDAPKSATDKSAQVAASGASDRNLAQPVTAASDETRSGPSGPKCR